MISAVICDFGGVLTSPLAASFAAFQAQAEIPAEALGEALAAIGERDGGNPLHALEVGELTERDFLRGLELELSQRLGRSVDMSNFADLYWSNLKPNQALIDLIRELRHARGYRTALLTNNVREWEARWRAMFAVEELFELVIDSSAVGLRKPNPEIYSLTLERLCVPAAECLFIDDFAHNCEAAVAAGMTAVHFRDNGQAIAEIEAALPR